MSPKRLRVAVVTDWSLARRGNHWESLVVSLGHEYLERRIADAVAPLDADVRAVTGYSFLEELDSFDVLIINWDALNGDPEFGADFAQRWFEHHRGEVLLWVKTGGLLLLEGQATLGVPTQRAYDALLGPGEVFVCGPEDELNPPAQEARFGNTCSTTAAAQRAGSFASALRDLRAVPGRTHEEMFPALAKPRSASFLSKEQWDLLYRGWFRRVKSRRFEWVPVIVGQKQGGRRHPTCLTARHGRGAIVVTTMFLASSRQEKLVEALLSCHGNVSTVPTPTAFSRLFVDKLLPAVISLVAGAVAGLLFVDDPVGRLGFLLGVTLVVFLLLQLVIPQFGWRFRRRLRHYLGT